MMEMLIKAGANINAVDFEGYTPLLCCARANDMDGISLLLKQKANPNDASLTNVTALHYAATYG